MGKGKSKEGMGGEEGKRRRGIPIPNGDTSSGTSDPAKMVELSA